jgi:hypothetical protein
MAMPVKVPDARVPPSVQRAVSVARGSPTPGPGTPLSQEDFRLRKKVLMAHPELATLHRELVMTGQITENEFWESRQVSVWIRSAFFAAILSHIFLHFVFVYLVSCSSLVTRPFSLIFRRILPQSSFPFLHHLADIHTNSISSTHSSFPRLKSAAARAQSSTRARRLLTEISRSSSRRSLYMTFSRSTPLSRVPIATRCPRR